ncbi:MAG: diaminopimelate decarboxylase, partial [Pseudomonas sp.]
MPESTPFPLLASAVRRHGSPLWVYDANTINARIDQLQGFDLVRYAQKANPNLHILRLMR